MKTYTRRKQIFQNILEYKNNYSGVCYSVERDYSVRKLYHIRKKIDGGWLFVGNIFAKSYIEALRNFEDLD